jgi:hypothetical protein
MDEHQPVDASEFVYRRIHRVYYQADLPMPIQPAAFRPTKSDDTGLSVFRAGFLQPVDTLVNIEASKRGDYYVARLAVADLPRLGLIVVPDPGRNGPPGHAVIPELSEPAYRADKQRLKIIQVELARLASLAIVHQAS